MDRRTFIRGVGAGALGLTALRPLAALAEDAEAQALPTRWGWGRILKDWDEARRIQYLDEVRAAGVQALLLGGSFDDRVLALARERDLEVHAWRWTLCRKGLVDEHPEWAAVNRKGESTAVKPPYVHYYKFLCPTREEVVEHLVKDYAEVAAREGLAGCHLDYVRYPDVILPRALWEKYGLVQDRELPEFDYCYCEVCRKTFEKETGLDPLKIEDAPSNEAWRKFRYDRVTHLVNRIAKAVHAKGSKLTAAVFPGPSEAKRLVRQDWAKWDLDAVFPMIYHSFHAQPIAWVETMTKEGVAALAGRRPLFAGLYLPKLKAEGEFEQAVKHARAGGATGIALFGGLRKIP